MDSKYKYQDIESQSQSPVYPMKQESDEEEETTLQPRYSSVLVVLSVARWEMRWEASTYTCVEACFPPPECRRSQAL
eukprot:9232627-Pyramimonas_sp.AAC.1